MAAVNGLPSPPPPPAAPASRERSDDGKRRNAEKERRKSQSQRDARHRPAPAPATGRADNWLKRETPFVCDIRFRNDLPEVPCDPKMLVAPLNAGQLAAFKLTTLERDPKRDLVLEPDLGIPLSVFDIERYSVPAALPQLAPEDQALLEDDDDLAAIDASPSIRVRQRLRGSKAELSWLMRTTYISNDTGAGAALRQGIPEKQLKVMRDAAAAGEADLDPLTAQIQAIEASFEAARAPPVHQKNPSLQPVQVLPVLPDEERWPVEYVQLVFDGEPTAEAEVPAMRGKPPELRRRYAERAFGRSIRVAGDEGKEDLNFVALLLPTSEPGVDRETDAGPAVGESQEMLWAREYNYSPAQSDQDFVFCFGDDCVRYVEMNLRLTLSARNSKQRQAARLDRGFVRPASHLLKRRPLEEFEEEARAKRVRILNSTLGYDEEEVAAEAAAAAAAEAEAGEGQAEDGEQGYAEGARRAEAEEAAVGGGEAYDDDDACAD